MSRFAAATAGRRQGRPIDGIPEMSFWRPLGQRLLPDESPGQAALRRLNEETGIDCQPTFAFRAEYRAGVTDRLTAHEIVHVFAGAFHADPSPDPDEVGRMAWADARRRARECEP